MSTVNGYKIEFKLYTSNVEYRIGLVLLNDIENTFLTYNFFGVIIKRPFNDSA